VEARDILLELYGRLPALVRGAVQDLPTDLLCRRPAPAANPVGWLVWHLTRVQDHHVAEVAGAEQVWAGGPWAGRFGLPADPGNTGYGHSPDQVAAVRPESWEALVGYYDAVGERTTAFLRGLAAADLDRIVDRRWDPPVTLGVRLASVADDDLQHAGQAAYLRGLLLN
jgi:DinB superfamily